MEIDMNLVHFVRSASKNFGSYHYLMKLSEGLHSYGVYTTVICHEGSKFPLDHTEFSDIILLDDAVIYDELERIKPDIIHFHDMYSFYLSKDNQVPLIYNWKGNSAIVRTIHDYSSIVCPQYFFYNHGIYCENSIGLSCREKNCIDEEMYNGYRRYLDSLKRDYDCLFYFSDNMRKALKSVGLPDEKCLKIPPLIAQANHFANAKKNTILFAGRLSNEKGVHCLLEALSLLHDKNWELVIVGMDNLSYYRQILRLCKKKKLTDNIRFTGFLDHTLLEDLYLETKLLIFPSTCRETYGFSGAEAISYGIPVVAFDIEGIDEWMLDGYTGIHVPVNNHVALAGAIELLLTNEEVYQRYRNNCIQWSNRLSLDEQINQMYKYYCNLLGNRKSTRRK